MLSISPTVRHGHSYALTDGGNWWTQGAGAILPVELPLHVGNDHSGHSVAADIGQGTALGHELVLGRPEGGPLERFLKAKFCGC